MLQASHFKALRRASPGRANSFQLTLLRAFASGDSSVSKEEMLRALDKFQKESASKTVPWFLQNMPPSYFRSIGEEDRVQHLNAITALVGAEQPEGVEILSRVLLYLESDTYEIICSIGYL
ncbi:hypothetical protein DVH05_017227 [Phytophthora capsici]|nr:hypothetical protein DVH05_017227 [Phytophthora capsici]